MPETKKKKPKKRRLRPIWRIVPIGLAALVLIAAMPNTSSSSMAKGREYLSAQDSKDIAEVQSQIQKNKIQQLGSSIATGEASIFSAFSDSVIMGDSRVYGFGSYGFLPWSQVYAAAGSTVCNIEDYLDVIQAGQPSIIYMAYGVNDMGLEIGKEYGEDGYSKVYEEQINNVLAVSPHSKIVVNSILEVTPQRLEQTPRWNKAEDWNKQLEAMCERNGWIFVNNSRITAGGQADIYQADGVHLVPDFYPEWAKNNLEAAIPELFDESTGLKPAEDAVAAEAEGTTSEETDV